MSNLSSLIFGMICGAIIATVFIILGLYVGIKWSVYQNFKELMEKDDEWEREGIKKIRRISI